MFQGHAKNETTHGLEYQFCCHDSMASHHCFQKTRDIGKLQMTYPKGRHMRKCFHTEDQIKI